MKDYPSKGCIVYYMGDNVGVLSKEIKLACKKVFEDYKEAVDFKYIFLVFRDTIINGTEIENSWVK